MARTTTIKILQNISPSPIATTTKNKSGSTSDIDQKRVPLLSPKRRN